MVVSTKMLPAMVCFICFLLSDSLLLPRETEFGPLVIYAHIGIWHGMSYTPPSREKNRGWIYCASVETGLKVGLSKVQSQSGLKVGSNKIPVMVGVKNGVEQSPVMVRVKGGVERSLIVVMIRLG